ncbi:G2/M phase-specific E3 ubiquitin-protein ligase [Merluccius polli]|uniref:G2/M phase-specific E3 ubiquitin-protein ligase n=1 Tax=Merluccius polli TaxID=89951 RepID=A0AA47NVX2_MERPO|nr:G2/M phase-specific E3 ubiquitin-protein ligase [Merluccius polli]
MQRIGVNLKPVRGKTLPLSTMPEVAAADLLKQAVQKLKTFNKDMDDGPYHLLFPDGSEVVFVPGTEKPFLLSEYKKEIGKPYARITLFVCPYEHFKEDSDSEVIVRTRRSVEFSEADTVTLLCNCRKDSGITVPDIIYDLSQSIDHGRVSRFNVCRSDVWDGALRGFKRSTFSEKCDLLVRFTDDAGVSEEAVDTGGPKREFLTLLMSHLKHRPIFSAPEGHPVWEDEVLLAGEDDCSFSRTWRSRPSFPVRGFSGISLLASPLSKPPIDLITDEDIGQALRQIESAASLEDLQDCTLQHNSMLQTAGCFRCVKSLEDKMTIVSDFLRWFIIDP